MQQLGMILNNYGSQNFPLEHSDTEFPAVIDKFQRTVTEVGLSWDLTFAFMMCFIFFFCIYWKVYRRNYLVNVYEGHFQCYAHCSILVIIVDGNRNATITKLCFVSC